MKKQKNGVGRLKVLEAHRNSPMASIDDLVVVTGMSRTTVHYHLCQLEKEGVITRNHQVGRIAGQSPVRRADRNPNGSINRVVSKEAQAQYYFYNCKNCNNPIMREEERTRGTCNDCAAPNVPTTPRVYVAEKPVKSAKKTAEEKRIERVVSEAKKKEAKQQSNDVFFNRVRARSGPVRGSRIG